MKIITAKVRALRALLFSLALLGMQGFALAQSTPETAVNTALGTVSASATSVINTAGGIVLALAVLAGLWMLGSRWARKAASGR